MPEVAEVLEAPPTQEDSSRWVVILEVPATAEHPQGTAQINLLSSSPEAALEEGLTKGQLLLSVMPEHRQREVQWVFAHAESRWRTRPISSAGPPAP